jgi:hypothetical protein
LCYAANMRDRIRKRLTEYRTEALDSIDVAVNRTKAKAARDGTMNSGGFYLFINEDNKTGFERYMDQSTNFIRYVAGSSVAQYADELRDAANKLKQEIIARMDRVNLVMQATPGHSTRVQLRNDLEAALDNLIKRKLENFEIGFMEGKDMNATTQNTVNIINSHISNTVMQITQSGKDAISKGTALKLQELVNSEEIKELPENDRLDVLDQAEEVIKELSSPATDGGKVVRGLRRLGKFISPVASKATAEIVTQLAVAYARAHGII